VSTHHPELTHQVITVGTDPYRPVDIGHPVVTASVDPCWCRETRTWLGIR